MHGDYCGSLQSRVVSARSEKLIIIRMYLWWSLCTYLVFTRDVPLVEFMYVPCIYTRCTSGGVYVRTLYLHAMYLWWSLCTYLVFTRDVPLVEFMYVPCIYTRCTSGGVYSPWSLCTYLVFTRVYLWWSLCTYLVFTRDVPLVEFIHLVFARDIPLVEFMYLVFTRMPDESYRRRLRSLLLYLCYIFRALIISTVF